MKHWMLAFYLIFTAIVLFLWADGPLYALGITISGRDIMGYLIPTITVCNLIISGLLLNKRI